MDIDFKHPTVRLLCGLIILIYLISPLDLFPDRIPVLGRIDDLAVLLYGLYLMSKAKKFGSSGNRQGQGRTTQAGTEEVEPQRSQTPFEVLGVSDTAPISEITAKYRELAAKYHPDKVVHLGDEFQQMAHRKMIEIQNAYETLSALRGQDS
jgi:DnaJ domain/Protein of unknown function (DUF1232)